MHGNRMGKLGNAKLGLSSRSTQAQRVLPSCLERGMHLVTPVLRLDRGHSLSDLETGLQDLADKGKSPLSHTTEK